MLPTSTRGTSGASPSVLRSMSFTCMIRSNEAREMMLNTSAYPCTPREAFRERREYSSCYDYRRCAVEFRSR